MPPTQRRKQAKPAAEPTGIKEETGIASQSAQAQQKLKAPSDEATEVVSPEQLTAEDLGLPGVEMSREAARQRFERLSPAMQAYVLERKQKLLSKYPQALDPGFVPPPEEGSAGGRGGFSVNFMANLIIFAACFAVLGYMVHVDYGLNIFEVIWESLLDLLDPGFDAQRQAAVTAAQGESGEGGFLSAVLGAS